MSQVYMAERAEKPRGLSRPPWGHRGAAVPLAHAAPTWRAR